MRGCRGVTLRAQMLFVLVQCKSALFVCPAGGASGGWGAAGSATGRGTTAITANVTQQLFYFIKIVLYEDSVLNKAILQNLLSGLATGTTAVLTHFFCRLLFTKAAVLVPR